VLKSNTDNLPQADFQVEVEGWELKVCTHKVSDLLLGIYWLKLIWGFITRLADQLSTSLSTITTQEETIPLEDALIS
jgi:hypothetical protein